MNPLGTRASAEELAALLDGAVAGPGALTAPYAGLALRLRALAPALDALAVPRADFRAALRQRLVAVATVQAAAAHTDPAAPYAQPVERPRLRDAAASRPRGLSWTQSRGAQRRIGVTAGAMASVVALTGVGVAATRSLPGQPFYAVKRLSEDAQLRLASGDTAKGSKHLEFAATRLREVKALAHHDGSLSLGASGSPTATGLALGGSTDERIASTLADFDSETKAGTALLTAVYRKTGKPAPLRIITTFTAQQRSRLAALLPALPPSVQPQARSSLSLVTAAGTDATDLLAIGTCGGSCYPGNAGPQLPAQPEPTPGATASAGGPSNSSDNGVPACSCGSPTLAPQPTTAPAPEASASSEPEPAPTPTADPSQAPAPSPSPTPLLPLPLPSLPVPVPTPTLPVPTLPVALPDALASALPTLPAG